MKKNQKDKTSINILQNGSKTTKKGFIKSLADLSSINKPEELKIKGIKKVYITINVITE